MNKLKFDLNQKTIFYIAVCSGIIFLILLAVILPLYHYSSVLVSDNQKLRNQLEEHKQLAPVYQNLLKSRDSKVEFALPNPEKASIPVGETGRFKDDLQKIAGNAGMTMASFTPNMTRSVGSSSQLSHDVVLKGEFSNFRKILVGLGTLPYLEKIEEISIQQLTDSMEFKMKIWIAVK